MSMLHLSYDDSAFLHSRDPASYEMAMALDIKPSTFLPEQYMIDHLLQPLASLPGSHSMPHFDMPQSFAPSQYHAMPYELQRASEMNHPIPLRPAPSEHMWPEHNTGSHFHGDSETSGFPASSFSQPSMFAPSTSTERMAVAAPQVAERANPPPPWTMSGSLDPSTGIYQIAPEHPRIRTAQACEKCRGRKAKCSGDHPVCERCRIRGLKCEYAPERKMRGPNKVRRKALSDDKSRRTSVASVNSVSSASTDDSHAFSSDNSNSSHPTEHHQFAMTLDTAAPAQSGLDSHPRPQSADSSSLETPRVERHRPPHIDLTGTRLYDRMALPVGWQETQPFGHDVDPSDPNFSAFRRASLPSYLMESFTNHHINRSPSLGHVYTPPRGIDVVHTTIARPRSNPSYTHDALSLYPGSDGDSSSGHSMSTPITPLTHPSDLIYPLDFDPEPLDFSQIDPRLHDVINIDAWTNTDAVASEDVTPRVNSDGLEKSLAQVESDFIHE